MTNKFILDKNWFKQNVLPDIDQYLSDGGHKTDCKKNDKVWIQRDGTEDGMATELLKEGIPKDKIVLGFRSPEMRRHTEFALE